MARFYKTSSDTPIDYMYKINSPLMEKVLLSNDAGITSSLQQDDQTDAMKNFQHISGADDAIAMAEQKKIQDQANSISTAIQGDYANWKKQLNPLRQFKQSVLNNYQSGNIAKLQANYNAMKANFDDIDKQVALYNKTGGVDKQGNAVGVNPIKAQLAKQYALNNYKGAIDPTTGAHNPFSTIPLMGDLNLDKTIGDAVSKIKADKNDTEMTKMNGAYFDDVAQKWSGVSDDKILAVAMNRITEDPAIIDNLRQSQQIGYISGAFDNKGNLNLPFNSVDNSKISSEEQQQLDAEQHRINILKRTNPNQAKEAQDALNQNIKGISTRTKLQWNNGSYLTPYFQSALDKYSGKEIENKQKLRNNSYANELMVQGRLDTRQQRQFRQEDYKQQQSFANAKALQEIKQRDKLDELLYKSNLNNNKTAKTGTSTGKEYTQPTLIGNTTSTPYAFLGTDANTVTKNLQDKLKSNLTDITALNKDKQAAIDNGDNDMVNFITNQIADKTSEQMTLANRDNKARADAVDKVIPKADLDLFHNRDKVKRDYQDLISSGKYDVTGKPIVNFNKDGISKVNIFSQEAKTNSETVANYRKIKQYESTVNSTYKDNLLKATKETTNGATIVGTTKANNDFIKQAITANPSSFKIIDTNSGQELNSFQDGKSTPYDADFNIDGAGPSSGANAKTMNIYGTYKGKKVLIVPIGLTANIVQNHLMEDWMQHGDSGAKQLTKTWGSTYYKAINEATTDIIQGDTNPFGLGQTHYTEIGLPNGQARISITKVGTTGYRMQIEGNNGWVTVPNTDESGKKVGDYFTNDADMTEALNKLDTAIRAKQK